MKTTTKILLLSILFALQLPVQGLCNEFLDSAGIRSLLSGRVILNTAHSRSGDYNKLINADGTWAGVNSDGEIAGLGFWRVSSSSQFCQSNQQRKSVEQCVTIKKDGDHFSSYLERDGLGLVKVSSWRVVDETPVIVAYRNQLNLEQAAVVAAYEKQTGNSYDTSIAANRQQMQEGYVALMAEYKKQALEALPAAGTK